MAAAAWGIGPTGCNAAPWPLARALAAAALGMAALALGLWVYAVARAPGAVQHPAALALVGWLPSLVHPFAFSLFSAALAPRAAGPRAWRVCGGWWAVNLAFEFGQHPAVQPLLDQALAQTAGDAPWARRLAAYFTQGSFDPGDLVAATLGALAAAAWITWPQADANADAGANHGR